MAIVRETNGGVQIVHRFPNNYGASIVQGPYTHGGSDGLWELCLIHFEEEAKDDDDYYLVEETTPLGEDGPMGHLSDDEVSEYLARIEALPPA